VNCNLPISQQTVSPPTGKPIPPHAQRLPHFEFYIVGRGILFLFRARSPPLCFFNPRMVKGRGLSFLVRTSRTQKTFILTPPLFGRSPPVETCFSTSPRHLLWTPPSPSRPTSDQTPPPRNRFLNFGAGADFSAPFSETLLTSHLYLPRTMNLTLILPPKKPFLFCPST